MTARQFIPRFIAALLALSLVMAVTAFVTGQVHARSNTSAVVRQTASSDHTISVSGHGEVTAAPDMATVTLGVQTKAPDAQSALSENASRMSAVINAIKGQGVKPEHIQTAGFSLWRDAQSDSYVVNHELTVRLDSISKVGPVLDAAVAAGATSSWGVQFGLKDMSALRSRALQAAIADARQRADSMASALGVSISGVHSASESSSYVPPIRYAAGAPAQGAAAPTPIQPGELTVSAEVSVSYTFG